MSVSVIVITLNEERNIGACLDSVRWADEIVVVDARSSDRTVEIAKRFTPYVYVESWKGYAAAKSNALTKTTREWVLWIDADERVTPELAGEVKRITEGTASTAASYEVARRAYFLGKWIKHCGWYPGYVVRLFRRESARFNSANVHEGVETTGTVARLQHDLLHYTDENLFHYFSKLNRYTSLAVEDLVIKARKFSLYDLLVRPSFLFVKMFVLQRGFLDGMHGLILSLLSAGYVFTKYAKLWERGRTPDPPPDHGR